MLRPQSWTSPAGGRPVRVIAGEPGGRPRSAVEGQRAERGAKSLIGGQAFPRAVGAAAHRSLLPSLAAAAVHGASPGEDQGSHRPEPGGDGAGGGHQPPGPVPSGTGPLPLHAATKFVTSEPLGVLAAVPLDVEEAGPHPAGGPGGPLDQRLVPRPGPAQAHGHYPISEGSLTMSRVTVGELYAGEPLERGMGNRAITAPRP